MLRAPKWLAAALPGPSLNAHWIFFSHKQTSQHGITLSDDWLILKEIVRDAKLAVNQVWHPLAA